MTTIRVKGRELQAGDKVVHGSGRTEEIVSVSAGPRGCVEVTFVGGWRSLIENRKVLTVERD